MTEQEQENLKQKKGQERKDYVEYMAWKYDPSSNYNEVEKSAIRKWGKDKKN